MACVYTCIINSIKGLSTAEGGRGHVTAHMYSVTVKVQTLDYSKNSFKDSELYNVHDNLWTSACGDPHPVLWYVLNLDTV